MTQDQYGQAQGTGYASEQTGHEDETEAQEGPMTRLKKVASALRGDQPDQPVTDQTVPDQAVSDQRVPDGTVPDELTMTSPDAPAQAQTQVQGQGAPRAAELAEDRPVSGAAGDGAFSDGTMPTDPVPGNTVPADAVPTGAVPTDDRADPEYATGTQPADAGAVRGTEGAVRDDVPGDDITRNEGAAAVDPSRPTTETSGTPDPAAAGHTVPAPEYGSPADTAAGYGGQAGTEPVAAGSRGTTQDYGSPAEPSSGYGTEDGTVNGNGRLADTATEQPELTGDRPAGTGTTEAGLAAAGAGVTAADPRAADPGVPGTGVSADAAAAGTAGQPSSAEDAGLRPGEATDRLGDFGDIAFGNLLPDAGEYSAQWEQIQFRFVDDPQGSVTEAAEVISQVTSKLEAAIQDRQRAIQDRQQAIQERASALRGRWGEGSNADTETLRETLRMYRAFMDQLVGPSS